DTPGTSPCRTTGPAGCYRDRSPVWAALRFPARSPPCTKGTREPRIPLLGPGEAVLGLRPHLANGLDELPRVTVQVDGLRAVRTPAHAWRSVAGDLESHHSDPGERVGDGLLGVEPAAVGRAASEENDVGMREGDGPDRGGGIRRPHHHVDAAPLQEIADGLEQEGIFLHDDRSDGHASALLSP